MPSSTKVFISSLDAFLGGLELSLEHVLQACVQVSGEICPAPAQWKDFCEQTPIDEARHSVTLFQLLGRYRMFSRGPVQTLSWCQILVRISRKEEITYSD